MDIAFRGVEPEDLEVLYAVENDAAAWRDGDTQAPYSRHLLRRYIQSQYIDTLETDPFTSGQLRLMAFFPKDTSADATINATPAATAGAVDGLPIGVVDFYDLSARHRRGFVGVYVLPQWRGRGVAKVMLEKAVMYGREVLMLENIAAKVLKDNEVSLHLFEKAGFRKCGELPKWHYAAGEAHDVIIFVNSRK